MPSSPVSAVAMSAPPPVRPAHHHDRAFYTGMAVLLALTVFAGFARTFYLRAFFQVPTISGAGQLTPLVQIHGAVFTAWVVLFIVQTALIKSRRVALHRRLGVAGMILAAIMVVVGLRTAFAAAARGSAPPGLDPLAFMIVPFTDMVLFTVFVTGAFVKRRDREAHKRLMLLAYVSIITAAIARIPGLISLGPLAAFSLSLVFVVLGIAYDRYSRRRIHPAYLWGGALILASVPGRLALSNTDGWRAFAELLIR